MKKNKVTYVDGENPSNIIVSVRHQVDISNSI